MKSIYLSVIILFLASQAAIAKDDDVITLALKHKEKNIEGAAMQSREGATEKLIFLSENDVFRIKKPGLTGKLPSFDLKANDPEFFVTKDVSWTTSIIIRDSFRLSISSLYWLMDKTYRTPNPWLYAINEDLVARFGRTVQLGREQSFSMGAFVNTTGPYYIYDAKPRTVVTPGLSLNMRF